MFQELPYLQGCVGYIILGDLFSTGMKRGLGLKAL